jgi:hypothetical protein
MINDSVKATGTVHIVITREDGEIEKFSVDNLVVTTGKAYIAQRMRDSSIPTQMTHIGIGTGTSASTAGMTALQTEVGTRSTVSTSISASTITYTAVFGVGNPGTTQNLTEAGIFSASSAGTMLARVTFPSVAKAPADVITIVWAVTIS